MTAKWLCANLVQNWPLASP